MAEGVVIVCTSNRAPWELSPAGAHEDMFAHFVGQLTRACPPFELSSERDYRRLDTSWQVGGSCADGWGAESGFTTCLRVV